MSAQPSSPEITFQPDHSGGTSRIWKIFWNKNKKENKRKEKQVND